MKTPGHVFPLRAETGGLASRRGHTEGSLELVRRAGLLAAAVIIEILNEDGTMARLDDVTTTARRLDLPLVRMSQLVLGGALRG